MSCFYALMLRTDDGIGVIEIPDLEIDFEIVTKGGEPEIEIKAIWAETEKRDRFGKAVLLNLLTSDSKMLRDIGVSALCALENDRDWQARQIREEYSWVGRPGDPDGRWVFIGGDDPDDAREARREANSQFGVGA